MNESFPMPSTPEEEPLTESQEIAHAMGNTFGEAYGFDAESLAEIASQPFELAYETAYGFLNSAGMSETEADEAMSAWTERRYQSDPPAQ